ncbi:translocation/assembly module TamB domain-containing protein [Rhizobium sp.]
MKWTGWLLARLFAAVGVLIVLAIAALAILGYTATGNQFLADQIASRVSTPDMQLRIEGARGLLAGDFRIDSITATDTKGQFANAENLAIDWSPWSLLTGEFSASRIAADTIRLDRPPVQTIESPPDDGSAFSLPVEVDIRKLDLPSLSFGPDILGRATDITLTGSAQGAADRLALTLDAKQTNQAGARAVADVVYAVNARTLKLSMDVSEPKGGLLGTMLQLPGNPAIDLSVAGDGPLDSWAGKIRASLDGVERMALDGSHIRNAGGVHQVVLSGGGGIGDLLPPALRTLFAGETAIDVDTSFSADGMLDIRSAKLSNDSLSLNVGGAIDPKGEATLNGSLRPTGAVLAVQWPLAQGVLDADIGNIALTASGPFQSVAFELSAALPRLATPAGSVEDVVFRLGSDSFNLATRSGQISTELTAEAANLADPQLAKLVRGPIKLTAPLTLTETSLKAEPVSLSSGAIGGTATLAYALDTAALDLGFKTFVVSSALLPPDLAAKAGNTLELSGKLAGTPDNLAFSDVQLTSGVATAKLDGTLVADELTASLTGDIPSLAAFSADVDGRLGLTATLSGPLSNLKIDSAATAEKIVAAGRNVENIDLVFAGQLDPAAPKANIKTSFTLDGQPVSASADVIKRQDVIAISAISGKIGESTLDGAINLGPDFLPTGKIDVKIPDLAPIGRLAGQTIEGDLGLALDLKPVDGKLTAVVTGNGARIAAQGNVLNEPSLSFESPDLIAQLLKGQFKATSLDAAGNRIDALTLSVDHNQAQTSLALNGRYDDAPLTLAADIQQGPAGIDLMLRDLKAAPRGLPLSLAEPAFVLVRDGTATIDSLRIALESGTVTLSGTAGDMLNLDVVASALPAAVANRFAADLDASGTIDAKATISGKAATPVIRYEFAAKNLTARPLEGRQPIDVNGNGTFEQNRLTAETKIDGIAETGALSANTIVQLGEPEIRIEKFDLASEALNGAITGSFQTASGALDTIFQLNLTGKRLLPADLQGKLDGPIRLTGAISGTADDLAFRDIKLASNILAADVSGTLKAGQIEASLSGSLPDLAALQPDASGSASLTATVTGPVATPSIKAELAATDAVLAGRMLQSLSAKLDAIADPKAPKATLTATGTIDGQTIDVSADITSDQGLIKLPALKAIIGRNNLTASLALDKAFLPAGTIQFDLPDIGLISALGGQKAEGDLKGQAVLDNAGGKLAATIKAEGSGIRAEGLSIRAPSVDLTIPDLLTGEVSGTITAAELAAGANRLDGVNATFALDGPKTDFKVAATYDDAPLNLDGSVLRDGTTLGITLDRFKASPRKLPVALASPTRITIANGVTDLGAISLTIAGGRIDVSGTVSDQLALKIDAPALPAALANVASPDLDASGTVNAHATISGGTSNPIVDFTVDGIQLTAKPLSDAGRDPLDIKASGRFANGKLSAKADVIGVRELGASQITADIALKDGSVAIDEVALTSSVLTARGDAILDGERLGLRLAGEITDLAAFLPQASGKTSFLVEADGPLAALPLKIRLEADNAVMAGKTLSRLVVDASATADPAKPTAKLKATGTIDGQAIDASADVVTEEGRIAVPDIKLNVGRNTITGAIRLTETNLPTGKLSFDLPEIGLLAALGGQVADGQLAGSIDLTETEGKISAAIKANGEGVTANGVKIGKPQIDLAIPDLIAGQITGNVRATDIVSGTNRLADLDARFTRSGATTDFDVKGKYDGAPLAVVGALETRAEGMAVTLKQFTASPRKIPVRLTAPVTINTGGGGAQFKGLKITAGKGSITVDGSAGEQLDIRIKVASLPASLANTFASGLDASGTIGADATVTGTSSNPIVNFTVNWQNALTSQIRTAGISAVAVNAKGKLQGSRLSIDTNVRGGGGLTVNADGTVDTASQALNLTIKGKLPFTAIAAQLAEQGLALKGNANFDLKIGGNAARPNVTGSITTNNGQFIVIRQNLVVNRLAATITLSGQTATIANLSGRLDGGGRVSASGTIGFTPNSGIPADLKIKLDRAVYADGRVVVAKVSGDLTITGPLQRGPVIGGTVRLARADITVPERLPASLANANVTHKNADAAVIKQSRELRADTSSAAEKKEATGLRLDLRIIANRKIFVRGRGLDAELGGQVRVSGSANAPVVSGGFRMVRGRLALVGKRLDFTSGDISFGGGLVPYLNMVASTTVNANTLNVNVTGLANDPSFSFTSSPALPQDEVLAQLIFGRDSSSLSPFQIAQLADAVATLSGGQRTSLFNKLRQGLGVDDLNVGTDENGGAQVTAGKYLNRRTYVEIMQGEDPKKSGVAINLDIGKGVKLRGQATQDGGTASGIFYEKEY